MGYVGYRTGVERDDQRPDWDGTSRRPLAWSAWYPCPIGSVNNNRPSDHLFDIGSVVLDGPLEDGPRLQVVLLSHGTGGSPESMGWLAYYIAKLGYVVIGAHHHGNTGREPYRAEGFLCWWERARDLSGLLTILSTKGPFANRLNTGNVHAVGYSLGGHSVLALAGAQSSMKRFQSWAKTRASDTGPPEFPNVADQIPQLMKSSPTFRASWARQEKDYSDRRIRSVIALAVAPPVRAFSKETLESIAIPVTLITGGADAEAPTTECADWLTQINARFRHVSVGDQVGHYTFLGRPNRQVSLEEQFLFSDNQGVDRAAVHERVKEIVTTALVKPND